MLEREGKEVIKGIRGSKEYRRSKRHKWGFMYVDYLSKGHKWGFMYVDH